MAALNEPERTTGIVVDRARVDAFAEILSRAVYRRHDRILATSTPILFRNEQNEEILRVQLFGRILRLNSTDYDIGQNTAGELAELVQRARSLAEYEKT